MLFETVLRDRTSLPAPVLMLFTTSFVANTFCSSLLAVELREMSLKPSLLFVLAEMLNEPVPFTLIYSKSPSIEPAVFSLPPFTLAAPLLITSFSTLEVLGSSPILKSA